MVNGKYHIRGIVSVSASKGDRKCDSKQAVAFSDVSFFLSWINQILLDTEITSSEIKSFT